MRSIAIFLPNWIGDVVMATPAIRAVRQAFPDFRLIAVAKPYVVETLAGNPWFDRVLLYERGTAPGRRFWAVARSLAAEKATTALLFPNSFRSALLARAGGCQRLIGFARYGRDFLLTDRLYARRGYRGQFKPTPIINDYNKLAIRLGTSDPGTRMKLHTTAACEYAADVAWARLGLGRFRSVIGLNPGGAFGAAKHWPTEHFARVAKAIALRGHGVAVLCGPTERDEATRIATMADHTNVVHFAAQDLSIGLTKASIRRMSALVTTDSGPRHFAAAFGIPAVSLFGPTHIEWTDTNTANERMLQVKLPCGPCQQRVCPEGHHRCMKELGPDQVLKELFGLLAANVQTREVGHVAEFAPAAA